jgi:hypothetical protein
MQIQFCNSQATWWLLLLCGLFPGCAPDKTASSDKTVPAEKAATVAPASPTEDASDVDHAHVEGAHGGIIVSLGRDSYHCEAIVSASGELLLYMLGNDETRVQEIEIQELVAYVKSSEGPSSQSVAITATPQPGDSEGKTSLFSGKLPADLVGQSIDVTIPSLRINGERFRLGFTTKSTGHTETEMPTKVADDAERSLYLTPGGIYTDEDITANGKITASEKFVGFKPAHDLKPKPGDKICPITLTKANPKCTWIVGGKTYEFCCPPCVDEFVTLAKSDPAAIKAPEDYVKQTEAGATTP